MSADIRARREAAGLSQAYAAAQAGISQAMLCQIERETKSPSLQVSREISAVLCCKLDDPGAPPVRKGHRKGHKNTLAKQGQKNLFGVWIAALQKFFIRPSF